MTTRPQSPFPASRFNALVFTLFLSVVALAFAVSEAQVALPENGETHTFTQSKPIAPLQIVTSGEKAHYFVKLVSANNKQTVQTIFVRSGETVDTKGSTRFLPHQIRRRSTLARREAIIWRRNPIL